MALTKADRSVFYSFNYDEDVMRVSQIRQMGVLQGQPLLDSNDWEKQRSGGPSAVKRWIDREMSDKSCLVVCVGSHTADRDWINYEIELAWRMGIGLLGVYVNKLADPRSGQSLPGENPFAKRWAGSTRLDQLVDVYVPSNVSPALVYLEIQRMLPGLVDYAIARRAAHP